MKQRETRELLRYLGEYEISQEYGQIIFTTQKDYQQKQRFQKEFQALEWRKCYNHPNVVKLLNVKVANISNMCSSLQRITTQYQFHHQTLKHEIEKRKHQNEHFPTEILFNLIKSTISAFAYFQENEVQFNDVNPMLLFLFMSENEVPEIKVLERLSGSSKYFDNKKTDFMTREKLYCSQQEYELFCRGGRESELDEQEFYNRQRYALGLIFLEAALLKDIQDIYDPMAKAIDQQKVQQYYREYVDKIDDSTDMSSVLIGTLLNIQGEEENTFIEINNVIIQQGDLVYGESYISQGSKNSLNQNEFQIKTHKQENSNSQVYMLNSEEKTPNIKLPFEQSHANINTNVLQIPNQTFANSKKDSQEVNSRKYPTLGSSRLKMKFQGIQTFQNSKVSKGTHQEQQKGLLNFANKSNQKKTNIKYFSSNDESIRTEKEPVPQNINRQQSQNQQIKANTGNNYQSQNSQNGKQYGKISIPQDLQQFDNLENNLTDQNHSLGGVLSIPNQSLNRNNNVQTSLNQQSLKGPVGVLKQRNFRKKQSSQQFQNQLLSQNNTMTEQGQQQRPRLLESGGNKIPKLNLDNVNKGSSVIYQDSFKQQAKKQKKQKLYLNDDEIEKLRNYKITANDKNIYFSSSMDSHADTQRQQQVPSSGQRQNKKPSQFQQQQREQQQKQYQQRQREQEYRLYEQKQRQKQEQQRDQRNREKEQQQREIERQQEQRQKQQQQREEQQQQRNREMEQHQREQKERISEQRKKEQQQRQREQQQQLEGYTENSNQIYNNLQNNHELESQQNSFQIVPTENHSIPQPKPKLQKTNSRFPQLNLTDNLQQYPYNQPKTIQSYPQQQLVEERVKVPKNNFSEQPYQAENINPQVLPKVPEYNENNPVDGGLQKIKPKFVKTGTIYNVYANGNNNNLENTNTDVPGTDYNMQQTYQTVNIQKQQQTLPQLQPQVYPQSAINFENRHTQFQNNSKSNHLLSEFSNLEATKLHFRMPSRYQESFMQVQPVTIPQTIREQYQQFMYQQNQNLNSVSSNQKKLDLDHFINPVQTFSRTNTNNSDLNLHAQDNMEFSKQLDQQFKNLGFQNPVRQQDSPLKQKQSLQNKAPKNKNYQEQRVNLFINKYKVSDDSKKVRKSVEKSITSNNMILQRKQAHSYNYSQSSNNKKLWNTLGQSQQQTPTGNSQQYQQRNPLSNTLQYQQRNPLSNTLQYQQRNPLSNTLQYAQQPNQQSQAQQQTEQINPQNTEQQIKQANSIRNNLQSTQQTYPVNITLQTTTQNTNSKSNTLRVTEQTNQFHNTLPDVQQTYFSNNTNQAQQNQAHYNHIQYEQKPQLQKVYNQQNNRGSNIDSIFDKKNNPPSQQNQQKSFGQLIRQNEQFQNHVQPPQINNVQELQNNNVKKIVQMYKTLGQSLKSEPSFRSVRQITNSQDTLYNIMPESSRNLDSLQNQGPFKQNYPQNQRQNQMHLNKQQTNQQVQNLNLQSTTQQMQNQNYQITPQQEYSQGLQTTPQQMMPKKQQSIPQQIQNSQYKTTTQLVQNQNQQTSNLQAQNQINQTTTQQVQQQNYQNAPLQVQQQNYQNALLQVQQQNYQTPPHQVQQQNEQNTPLQGQHTIYQNIPQRVQNVVQQSREQKRVAVVQQNRMQNMQLQKSNQPFQQATQGFSFSPQQIKDFNMFDKKDEKQQIVHDSSLDIDFEYNDQLDDYMKTLN